MALALSETPAMFYPFSSYQMANRAATGMADVDRMQPKGPGCAAGIDLFGSLQLYFGSQYINDFNLFGPYLPGHGPRRMRVSVMSSDIDHLYIRVYANQGDGCPLNTHVTLRESFGGSVIR